MKSITRAAAHGPYHHINSLCDKKRLIPYKKNPHSFDIHFLPNDSTAKSRLPRLFNLCQIWSSLTHNQRVCNLHHVLQLERKSLIKWTTKLWQSFPVANWLIVFSADWFNEPEGFQKSSKGHWCARHELMAFFGQWTLYANEFTGGRWIYGNGGKACPVVNIL